MIIIRNEFIGEIVKYCMDGEYIWFYDEISGGLYRLDTKFYFVEVVLTPMEIHQKKLFPVKEILKWKNEVYLIPNNISHEWLVYNIADKQLRNVLLSSQPYEIDRAVNIGNWIYLIPEKTNHILAIVEAETFNIKIITTDWYKNAIKNSECWGYSLFEDTVLFPIIGAREIFQIQGEEIIQLPLHIKQSIYSVSLSKNGIWILPNEGNSILLVGKNGELIESVKIWTKEYKDAAERFARILAVDRYVYLFPKQGSQIWVLDASNKKWTIIGDRDVSLHRPFFQKTESISTYWGYYYNEERLYTLPLKYRFAEINVENKLINYIGLQYAITLSERQYMAWVYWFHGKTKIYFTDKGRNSLKSFCKIASEQNITHDEEYIGKRLWMILGKRNRRLG